VGFISSMAEILLFVYSFRIKFFSLLPSHLLLEQTFLVIIFLLITSILKNSIHRKSNMWCAKEQSGSHTLLLNVYVWAQNQHNLYTVQFDYLENDHSMLTLFFFFCDAGAWTQGLHLKPLHQLCDRFFWDPVSGTICVGWLHTTVLLISASWVARITGLSHWYPT
jgi:hypothetical protein